MPEIIFPAGKARAVVIPGQEAFNDSAKAFELIPKCALIKLGVNGAELNDTPYPAGVALETGDPGDQAFSYGKHTEVAGYSSVVTPGGLVWPSAAVDGGMVDGPNTGARPADAKAGSVPCGSISSDGKRIMLLCV